MPMTEEKAQQLLDTYQEKLNSVQKQLNELDQSTISDDYSVEKAQTDLVESFDKQDKRSETTFVYLARTYDNRAQALYTFENEIREGLKAEPVVEVTSTVDESATIALAPVVTTPEGESENKDDVPATNSTISVVEDENEASVGEGSDLSADDFIVGSSDAIDWALWLQCGALSACLVASLAACVVAATAVSGFVLANSFGFFNSNSDDLKGDSVASSPTM